MSDPVDSFTFDRIFPLENKRQANEIHDFAVLESSPEYAESLVETSPENVGNIRNATPKIVIQPEESLVLPNEEILAIGNRLSNSFYVPQPSDKDSILSAYYATSSSNSNFSKIENIEDVSIPDSLTSSVGSNASSVASNASSLKSYRNRLNSRSMNTLNKIEENDTVIKPSRANDAVENSSGPNRPIINVSAKDGSAEKDDKDLFISKATAATTDLLSAPRKTRGRAASEAVKGNRPNINDRRGSLIMSLLEKDSLDATKSNMEPQVQPELKPFIEKPITGAIETAKVQLNNSVQPDPVLPDTSKIIPPLDISTEKDDKDLFVTKTVATDDLLSAPRRTRGRAASEAVKGNRPNLSDRRGSMIRPLQEKSGLESIDIKQESKSTIPGIAQMPNIPPVIQQDIPKDASLTNASNSIPNPPGISENNMPAFPILHNNINSAASEKDDRDLFIAKSVNQSSVARKIRGRAASDAVKGNRPDTRDLVLKSLNTGKDVAFENLKINHISDAEKGKEETLPKPLINHSEISNMAAFNATEASTKSNNLGPLYNANQENEHVDSIKKDSSQPWTKSNGLPNFPQREFRDKETIAIKLKDEESGHVDTLNKSVRDTRNDISELQRKMSVLVDMKSRFEEMKYKMDHFDAHIKERYEDKLVIEKLLNKTNHLEKTLVEFESRLREQNAQVQQNKNSLESRINELESRININTQVLHNLEKNINAYHDTRYESILDRLKALEAKSRNPLTHEISVLKKAITKKVDTDILKQLVPHMATKEEVNMLSSAQNDQIEKISRKVEKSILSNLSPESIARNVNSKAAKLVLDWSVYFNKLLNNVIDEKFKAIELQLDSKLSNLQSLVLAPRFSEHLLGALEAKFGEVELKLRASIKNNLKTTINQALQEIISGKDQTLRDIKQELEAKISNQMQVLKNQQDIALLENSPFESMISQLSRDVDEKLYLICSDLAQVKALYAKQLEQPFYKSAQWIWNSGKLIMQSAIPWNIESSNSDVNNFKWTQDNHQIRVVEAGLYEINLSIFTKAKPSLQLIINGESVLSALNSPSYMVHHSSGFVVDGQGKREPGVVTGISLVVLKPKIRIF